MLGGQTQCSYALVLNSFVNTAFTSLNPPPRTKISVGGDIAALPALFGSGGVQLAGPLLLLLHPPTGHHTVMGDA